MDFIRRNSWKNALKSADEFRLNEVIQKFTHFDRNLEIKRIVSNNSLNLNFNSNPGCSRENSEEIQ